LLEEKSLQLPFKELPVQVQIEEDETPEWVEQGKVD